MKILAVLPEANGARACLEAALAAASADPEAAIEAFHVRVDPDQLIRAPEEIAIQRLRESKEGTADARAKAVKRVFDEWMTTLTSQDRQRVRWREVAGAEQEQVLREAKGADLLVLARPHNMDAGDAFHAAVFASHRPLLVPPDWPSQHRGVLADRMAIAWHPTDQARRAVRQALPWLKTAQRVIVLVVTEHQHEIDPAEVEGLLSAWGLNYQTTWGSCRGHEPGAALLQALHEAEADALVMGAYRHNEWVEWALGGTTRYVLAHADVPLLLGH